MKLVRHSLYNLLGLGLPLIAAVYCIPVLIKELGDSKFGLLTLIWAVVGYFGLFDLGLGRALTQQLAVAFTEKSYHRVGPLLSTAMLLMMVLGIIASIIMALAAPWAVSEISLVPDRNEAVFAAWIMATSMPMIVMTSGFRGVLEAQSLFGIINLIRLPMGLFTFLAPLLVILMGSVSLVWIASVLVLGRVIACIFYAYFSIASLPQDCRVIKIKWSMLKPLCTSGGWMTVSNIISPLMSYIDRFVVAAMLSTSAVAYYATPQEIVTKLWVIPGALTACLFPKFSSYFSEASNDFNKLYFGSIIGLAALLIVPVLILSFAADSILSWWISSEFAANASPVLAILSWGMFIGCLASIPFTVLQSAGKAKFTAILHLIELPFFAIMLYLLIESHGLIGAAIAWSLRALFDAALLFYATRIYHSCDIFRIKAIIFYIK